MKELDARLEGLKGPVVPSNVTVTKTRDYGKTADEKSNELIFHVALATLSVVILMALFLGRREAVVVLVAVPMTLALTLSSSYLFGYTLNRVTLFALIFAIGILVDDAIVVVENVHRHYELGWGEPRLATVYAVDEVGNPTILATFTVVAALLPLAFVSGLMGPYMRPIPVERLGRDGLLAPRRVHRLAVAHIPALPQVHGARGEEHFARRHRRAAEDGSSLLPEALAPLLGSAARRWVLARRRRPAAPPVRAACSRAVRSKVKMLPYDNKSELQVIVDMPEGTTLEATAAVASEIAVARRTLPEVTDLPGLRRDVRSDQLQRARAPLLHAAGPNVADIQVNLAVQARAREAEPHDRQAIRGLIATDRGKRGGASVKVAEVPPGPPVLSTMVAEIYGPDRAPHRARGAGAGHLRGTAGVVDVDWYVEDAAAEARVRRGPREGDARAGVDARGVGMTLRLAVSGSRRGPAPRGGRSRAGADRPQARRRRVPASRAPARRRARR